MDFASAYIDVFRCNDRCGDTLIRRARLRKAATALDAQVVKSHVPLESHQVFADASYTSGYQGQNDGYL